MLVSQSSRPDQTGIHMARQGKCAGTEQTGGLELGYCESRAGEGSGGSKGVQGKESDWTRSYFLDWTGPTSHQPSLQVGMTQAFTFVSLLKRGDLKRVTAINTL